MDFIKFEKKENIGIIYFNRPEKHNSFTSELLSELKNLLSQLEKDTSIRLLVFRGEGEKSFSSGVDLNFLSSLKTPEQNRAFATLMEATSLSIYNFPKPTIAAVNGYAFGGGFGFAAACDLRIMAEETIIGFPAVKLGAIMPVTCTSFVANLIGFSKTKRYMLTGENIDAETSLNIGLVDFIVQKNQLMNKVFEVANMILEGTDIALNLTKKTINLLSTKDLKMFNLYAPDNFAYLSQTKEWQERMSNYLKKKKKGS